MTSKTDLPLPNGPDFNTIQADPTYNQFRSDRSNPVQFSAAHLVARSGTVGTDVRGMRYWADHRGMVVPIGSVLYSSVVEFPKR